MINSSGRNGGFNGNANGSSRLRGEQFAEGTVDSRERSMRDIYRIIFRHQRKMLAFFLLTMAVAIGIALFFPKSYRSEAKLFVRLGRENVGLDATTTLGSATSVSLPPQRDEEMNTEVEVLKSHSLLEKIVDAIGPTAILTAGRDWTPDGPEAQATQSRPGSASSVPGTRSWIETSGLTVTLTPRERAMQLLSKKIGVEATKKTNIIMVSCESASPHLAQLVVSKLIDSYGELHGRINRSARAHEFLAQQSTNLKGELNGLENQIRVLKNTTGLAAPAEQRAILVTRIGRLEDDLKATWTMIAATKAETGSLKTEMSQMSETQVLTKADGLPNVAADGMRQQLYTLELKEKDLASRVTDQHVELRAVREQLAAARSVVDSLETSRTQFTRGPNKTFEELRLLKAREDSVLSSLGAKASAYEVQLSSSKKELEILNNNEMRIGQLDREIQIRDRSYRKYADSLEQARIDDSLEKERISNINIAQPPTLDRLPIRPRPALALLLGLVAAVVGTVAIPLVAEYLDHTLKTSDEIESRLNLPVLVSIPRLRSNDPSQFQMLQ